MSQAIHYVVDKAYDKGSKAKVTPKGDSGEKNQSAETNEKKEVEGENQVNTAKESVDSNNSNNSNPSDNANPTQRKRSKEKGPEENETSPKKARLLLIYIVCSASYNYIIYSLMNLYICLFFLYIHYLPLKALRYSPPIKISGSV